MKTTTSKIFGALFAILSTLSAKELIKVSAVSDAAGAEFEEMPYTNGELEQILNVKKVPIVATDDISTLSIGEDPLVVIVQLTPEGRKKMMTGTADMAGKRIAVIINDRIKIVPMLQQAPLGGEFHITGFKEAKEAKALLDEFNKKQG